jgi:hypothetical protein
MSEGPKQLQTGAWSGCLMTEGQVSSGILNMYVKYTLSQAASALCSQKFPD